MVRIGDLLHTASIVAGATQLAAMIADANGKTQIFSDFYNSTGFCRANESDQGFDSFKLCFIVDTLYCIFAFLFLRAYPHTDKVKADARELWYGIPGVFFHGMAHLGQYYWYVPGENLVGTRFSVTEGIPQHLKKVLAILFLWAFLSRSVLGNFKRSILSAPVLTMFHYFVIPQKFLFSYVNFTLITLFSLSSLLQERKDVWYDLYAGIVVFPIAMVGWMEGYFCLDFVLAFGGHVLYDGWICVGNVIFIIIAFTFTEPTKKKKA